jgi:hypothetical protein
MLASTAMTTPTSHQITVSGLNIHFLQEDAPEEVAKLMADFLNSQGQARRARSTHFVV